MLPPAKIEMYQTVAVSDSNNYRSTPGLDYLRLKRNHWFHVSHKEASAVRVGTPLWTTKFEPLKAQPVKTSSKNASDEKEYEESPENVVETVKQLSSWVPKDKEINLLASKVPNKYRVGCYSPGAFTVWDYVVEPPLQRDARITAEIEKYSNKPSV